MSSIIKLLPESIANQIAAGEVVQRPASVVKELLENSVDAGSSNIVLRILNSGKTLVQVVDDGCGMNAEDAEMCLQRHATSKISTSKDLFSIDTMGFRGEAMASIAAISHLELKTRSTSEETGLRIKVVGGKIEAREECAMETGTSISVSNLFFNVPARRNFLKSDQVEIRHIIEEFQRVAITRPDITFKFINNEEELFHLKPGNLRHRITAIFGKKYNQRLVPVQESTDVVQIDGFITKPEFARKVRGEQFFFVNKRFIKSPYLHHAVKNAFKDLIPDDSFPSYFIQLQIDPARIDVNIHPTKTEVKFEEEKSIYAIVRTSVKQALGKYNISPTLDFDQETSFDIPHLRRNQEVKIPEIQVDRTYNPFNENKAALSHANSESAQDWQQLFESEQQLISPTWEEETFNQEKIPLQINNRYIVSGIKNGLVLIDQHRAHQKILMEKYKGEGNASGQQLVFPELIELSATDFTIAKEILPDLTKMGYDIQEFGKNTLKVNALPITMDKNKGIDSIEAILQEIKSSSGNLENKAEEQLQLAICKKLAIPYGKQLKSEEMSNLIDELFACDSPDYLPNGKKITITLPIEELIKKFE